MTKRKFEKNNLKNAGILSFAVNKEKRVNNILKKLVASNSISRETRRFIKPVRTGLGIIYGLGKVHKDIINNCPSDKWLIFSAINIPTYKLTKFLVIFLKSLTSNEYIGKDSLAFTKEIVEQNSDFSWET